MHSERCTRQGERTREMVCWEPSLLVLALLLAPGPAESASSWPPCAGNPRTLCLPVCLSVSLSQSLARSLCPSLSGFSHTHSFALSL